MTTEMDSQMAELAKEIFEICVKNGKSAIDEEEAAQKVRKILANSQGKVSSSLIFDILEMVEVSTSGSQIDAEAKKKMCALLKKCSEASLPEDVVKVNFESINDDAAVNTRYVKMKTKLFFKQLKFNLLREESEGYAKLITELSHHNAGVSPGETLNRVRCLIGQFNLDPNRALDIIVECFESALEEIPVSTDVGKSIVVAYYTDLLKAYHPNADDLCHIVGFKFTFYTTKRAAASAVSAPASLYLLAAVLISHGMIDIAELCSYLSPKVEPILAEHKENLEAANARCKSLSCSALGPDWDPAEGISDESPSGEQAASTSNQKIGLTQALLRLDAWKEAKYMLDRLPEFYAVRHPAVATSMCRMIDSMISVVYKKFCPQYCIATIVPDSSESGVETLTEFVRDVLPIVTYLGPHLSIDPVLMTKLIRLCVVAYAKASHSESSEMDSVPITDVCEDVLLPSLARLRSNCPMSEELWMLLSQFPYTTRFRMYGRLKGEHEKRHPILIIAKGETIGKARYIMKRVSKETTKTAGRQLGKLSHSYATAVFDYILNQIQQFENLIGPVVDSLKFLTNLSYDALAYSIIEHLSSPEKEKLKVSDATLSPWLQSLATFVGSVCKKYNVELTGILQYVANQLKSGKSFDLLVLRQIIENMSGVETTSGLTRDQLEALSGGDTLKSEAGNFSQIRNTKKSANRLKDALMQEDLVVSLCILMGQQRGCIVFNEGERLHLKLAGQMLDQCQDTLVQFGDFLATSLKSEDYVKRMPPAPDLISSYHLAPETAMFLSRPAYTYKILAKYEELKKSDRSNKIALNQDRKLQHYKTAWEFVFGQLSNDVSVVFPAKTWLDMKPRIFCVFWLLTMYDLSVPTAAYEREIERLKKLTQQSDESRDISDAKRRKEKERNQQVENKLLEEQRRQQEHVDRVMAQLMEERQEWFPPKAARNASIAQFLQLCLLPRILFSDGDALYAAKFISMLHRIKTPNFTTLICYDRVFCDLGPIIFSMSENEANHYGLFLCAALETVMHWWSDQETFDKECTNYPGFITRFRNPANEADAANAANSVVDFDTFRHVVHKWHFKLTRTFLMALASSSFVSMRNALLVLRKILPQYPASTQFSLVIEKKVVQIRDEEKEKRQDLHILAASYWGKLKVRKGPLLMDPDNQKEKEVSSSQASVRSRTAVPATPEKSVQASTSGAANRQGQATASTSTEAKNKATSENGVASASAGAAASPARTGTSSGAKITLRKENKAPASSTTKKPVTTPNSDTPADGEPATAVKRSADSSTVDKKSKVQQPQPQKSTASPSSPAPGASSNVNGGGTATRPSTTQQATTPTEGEPKAKRSRRSVETVETGTTNPNGASAEKTSTAPAADVSPKRTVSKKTAEKPEEAEPKSKRRKVEDQSPRSDKVAATPPPILNSASSHRRDTSPERRHGSDRESRDRDRERNEKIPRTSSHAALASERHEKKEATKREKSPKSSTQSPIAPISSSSRKKDAEDSKSTQAQDRGSSSSSTERRKLKLSSSSSKQSSSEKPPSSSNEKSKHGSTTATKSRDDERRSSRSRKD